MPCKKRNFALPFRRVCAIIRECITQSSFLCRNLRIPEIFKGRQHKKAGNTKEDFTIVKKRILSAALSLTMLLPMMPVNALALDEEVELPPLPEGEGYVELSRKSEMSEGFFEGDGDEIYVESSDSLEEDDPLYSAFEEIDEDWLGYYIQQQMFGESATFSADEQLTNTNDRALYEKLKTLVQNIAKGEGASSKYVFTPTETVTYDPSTKTLSGLDYKKVWHALLADCPFDLYWHDKTKGISAEYSYNSSTHVVSSLTIRLCVAEEFSVSGQTEITEGKDTVFETNVKSSATEAVKDTAETVKDIVSKYADKSDYEKLVAYKEEICNRRCHNIVDMSNCLSKKNKFIKVPMTAMWISLFLEKQIVLRASLLIRVLNVK